MSNSGKGKSFAVGAVVGGVLGAVSALLLAPKSGRELRKDIAEGCETAAQKTAEIAGAVSSKTQEIAKTVGGQTADWYGKAVELAGTVVDEVKAWKSARRDLPEVEEAIETTESVEGTQAEAEEVVLK